MHLPTSPSPADPTDSPSTNSLFAPNLRCFMQPALEVSRKLPPENSTCLRTTQVRRMVQYLYSGKYEAVDERYTSFPGQPGCPKKPSSSEGSNKETLADKYIID